MAFLKLMHPRIELNRKKNNERMRVQLLWKMQPSWNESSKPVCGYIGSWVHMGLLVLIFIRIKLFWNRDARIVGTIWLMKCIPQHGCNMMTAQHGWKCSVFLRNFISPGDVALLTSSHYLAESVCCSAGLDGLSWKMAEEAKYNRCYLAELKNLNSRVY